MCLSGAFRVVLCVVAVAAALLVVDSPSVTAMSEPMSYEMVMIAVNCSDSSVMTMLMAISDNDTLIQFPSPVNLNDADLVNAVTIGVISSTTSSTLGYIFEGISETEARANGDAVTPSIETAFGVSFAWDLTETIDTQVHVNYTGSGQANMASFVSSMVSQCVYPGMDGFCEGIPNLAIQTTMSAFVLTAGKESGGYNWTIGIGAMSISTIPTGSNTHTINVFDILGVSSLTPSPYSFNATEDYYQSTVWLMIHPETPISFVDCSPPEKEHPEDLSERGWTHMFPMFEWAIFYFGNESTSPEMLTFTFSGTVIPEFKPSTIIIMLILVAACMIAFKKRMLRRNYSQTPSF